MSSQKPLPPEEFPNNVIPFPVRKKKINVLKALCLGLVVGVLLADFGLGVYLIMKFF